MSIAVTAYIIQRGLYLRPDVKIKAFGQL